MSPAIGGLVSGARLEGDEDAATGGGGGAEVLLTVIQRLPTPPHVAKCHWKSLPSVGRSQTKVGQRLPNVSLAYGQQWFWYGWVAGEGGEGGRAVENWGGGGRTVASFTITVIAPDTTPCPALRRTQERQLSEFRDVLQAVEQEKLEAWAHVERSRAEYAHECERMQMVWSAMTTKYERKLDDLRGQLELAQSSAFETAQLLQQESVKWHSTYQDSVRAQVCTTAGRSFLNMTGCCRLAAESTCDVPSLFSRKVLCCAAAAWQPRVPPTCISAVFCCFLLCSKVFPHADIQNAKIVESALIAVSCEAGARCLTAFLFSRQHCVFTAVCVPCVFQPVTLCIQVHRPKSSVARKPRRPHYLQVCLTLLSFQFSKETDQLDSSLSGHGSSEDSRQQMGGRT